MPVLRTMTVTVLYIAGHGRSGSTLVERVLGSGPGAVAVGEVVHLWRRGLRDDERCGCGQPFSACPFWQAVGRRAWGGWDQVDATALLDLQDRVDHTRLIPAMLSRAVLPRYRAAWRRYGSLLGQLYAAIAEVAGVGVVVDSSKHVSTAYLLATLPDVDLRVVQLVRDPRGVTWSWGKRIRKPEVHGSVAYMPTYRPARVAARWTLDNLALHALRLLGVRTVLLRYEALLRSPSAEVSRVLRVLGVGVGWPEALVDDRSVQLPAGHSVAGNPMRFTVGRVALRLDDEWRARLPRGARALVTTICLPLLFGYGYLRARPDAAPPGAPSRGPAPSVSVVIPTRDRPELLARALAAVRAQRYDGFVECIVVFDRSAPDPAIADATVRVLANVRTPGLAGARNSGVLAAAGELVAFCDDDDEWYPDKLASQVEALRLAHGSDVVVGGMTVRYEGRDTDRVPPRPVITFADLLRSRVAEAHPSTFVARRLALLDGIGLFDEQLPGSYAEDYEWLLRAARRADIAVVRRPLVRVLWHGSSYFSRDWATIAAALTHLLQVYPEFAGEARGTARILGQIAFAQAAAGQRRDAARSALAALRRHPAERRGPVALLVAAGALRADTVLRWAHRRGRGL